MSFHDLNNPAIRRIAAKHGETAALDTAKLAALAGRSDERKALPSASSAHRYAQCPGSFLLEQECPPGETTPEAELGNRVHAYLAGELAPQEITVEEQEIADRCESQALDIAAGWYHGNPDESKTRAYYERRIWAFDENLQHAWSGKADLVYVNSASRRALVIDYKTGRGDVELAPGNLQLRALAVLLADSEDVQEVTVAIVQPLAGKPSVCVYNSEEIDRAISEIHGIMRAVRQPGRVRIPSTAACKYCRAKEVCPEARALVQNLPATVSRDGRAIVMTPEQIAAFLDIAPAAEGVIESVREKAKRMLADDPNAIPGWTLKPGDVREKVTKPEEVFGRFVAQGGTQEQFMGSVTITKKGLKDAIRAATGAKGKALDSLLDRIIEGCTERKQNAPSLVKS